MHHHNFINNTRLPACLNYGTDHSQRREYESRPALDPPSTQTRPACFPQRPTNSRVTRIHSSSLYPLDGSFTGHARTLHVVHTIIQGRAVNGN